VAVGWFSAGEWLGAIMKFYNVWYMIFTQLTLRTLIENDVTFIGVETGFEEEQE
jgi:hypothetical protein